MDTYTKRRLDLIGMIGKEGIAILCTAYHLSRNGDVLFQFRPDSDFYYLTHFPEPEAIAIFAPGRPEGEFLLFCREKDPLKEQWDGRRTGLEDAIEYFAADQAFPISKFENHLPALLESREKVYTIMGRYPDFDNELMGAMNKARGKKRSGVHIPGEYIDLRHILHEMRLIKNTEEIKAMRAACKIATIGHSRAMSFCAPGKYEYQVQAAMEYEFSLAGSEYTAYPSIVAGGANACILHYTENKDILKNGDLLLIDAGAELDCYASDITRTFPVNGRFSAAQQALYELVLHAQKMAIDEIYPDNPVIAYHETAVAILTQGMVDLGLLQGEINELIETQAYSTYYMHRTGHWLGLDVHDVGDYKVDNEWRILEPGMVLTVEPGIYIDARKQLDEKWHNMGIRIEDDILVTKKGHENLTIAAPKEVADIETVMAPR